MIAWARDLVVGLCGARAGLRMSGLSDETLQARLAPLARREGFSSIEALLAAVRDRDDERVAWRVVEAMSPPRPHFFEDPPAFEHLVSEVLPGLTALRPKLRIWVIGAGAGQEAYSLAIALDESQCAAASEIIASDLNGLHLQKAQAGLYTAYEVQQGLSARRLVRYFEQKEGAYLLAPSIRQRVRLARINLLDDLVRIGRFDVIVCRDILPHLTEVAQRRVASALAGALNAGGQLLLGSAEPPPGADWTPSPGPRGFFGVSAQALAA